MTGITIWCVCDQRSEKGMCHGKPKLTSRSLEKSRILSIPFAMYQYHRQKEAMSPAAEQAEKVRVQMWGVLLIVFSVVGAFSCFYAIFMSKWLPYTGFALLDAVKDDHHYCYLMLALIPASGIFIYANWLSLKFFRHN